MATTTSSRTHWPKLITCRTESIFLSGLLGDLRTGRMLSTFSATISSFLPSFQHLLTPKLKEPKSFMASTLLLVLLGHVINLNQQIRNFEEVTLPELEAERGRCTTSQSLDNYLFVVGTGGNDYSFNYFLTTSTRNVTLETFTANLTASLSTQLKKLHSLGARKFVLMSVNPLGCSPVVRMGRPTHNGCMQKMNRAAHLFNTHLKSLVDGMRAEMPGSALVFVNSYKIIRDIIKNPMSKGFKDASTTCCEVASINEGGNGILCKKGGQVCGNRSSLVFFDGLHPTEAVNVQIATKAFASSLKTEVYPTNIERMTTRNM
ncbi:unnamed protein product [Malus baccata var. baccata]